MCGQAIDYGRDVALADAKDGMPTPCSAIAAVPGMGAYNVTKAGVVALSETLAAEAARDGVGVTVLLPGFFPTNIVSDAVGTVEEGKRWLAVTWKQRKKYNAAGNAR